MGMFFKWNACIYHVYSLTGLMDGESLINLIGFNGS